MYLSLIITLLMLFPQPAFAQAGGIPTEIIDPAVSVSQEFFRARVVEVVKDEETISERFTRWERLFKVKILSGSQKGNELEISDDGVAGLDKKINIPKISSTLVSKNTIIPINIPAINTT